MTDQVSSTSRNCSPMVWKDEWENADPEELGEQYVAWVHQLTAQGLHAKADIATVLAILSNRIKELSSALSEKKSIPAIGLLKEMGRQRDALYDALRVAFQHVDSTSHCKDHAMIAAALAQVQTYRQRLTNIAEGIGMTYDELMEAMKNAPALGTNRQDAAK